MSKKTITYQESLERSWPQGRNLASVMMGVAGTKKESKRLQALRLSLEKIAAAIQASCDHPLDRLVIDEEGVTWTVRCTTCNNVLLEHTR